MSIHPDYAKLREKRLISFSRWVAVATVQVFFFFLVADFKYRAFVMHV